MDGYNVNATLSVNVTETIEAVAEVAANINGERNYEKLLSDINSDLRVLLNITRYIEQTTLAHLKEKVAWVPFERLLKALGFYNTTLIIEEL